MEDRLIMTVKELERKAVMEQVKQGYISQAEASRQLKLSYRQTKRAWLKYCREGDVALVHRSKGRPSGQEYSKDFKQSVVTLYEDRYMGFGPQHASEKMLQYEDITIVPETLRLWLKEAGLWSRQRRRQAYRKRRERKAHFGDMIQIDGSIHEWIEGQPKSCLLNMVDDATGITYAQIDTGETTRTLLECLLTWIKRYGIPKSVYVDRKTVYIGRKDFSVFQAVCQRLGIKVIRAYSPQAKGRVECKHNVFQTRFVNELRLLKIPSIDKANDFLTREFLDDINRLSLFSKLIPPISML